MVKLTHPVKAFTLVESMVAMVIVILIFSLSSIVVINVTSSGMSREKQNAYMLVKSYRDETIREDRLIDETTEMGDFVLEKTIVDYGREAELKELSIVAFKDKKKVFETKELILLKSTP